MITIKSFRFQHKTAHIGILVVSLQKKKKILNKNKIIYHIDPEGRF